MADTPTLLPLLEILWHSPEFYEIRLARGTLDFMPGDCVALQLPSGKSRPYSIASGPTDPWLAFLLRRMPGGGLSDHLCQVPLGTLISVSPPFGWFRPAAGDWPRVFLATSTGIAPFLSVVRAGICPPPLACFYGVRQRQDALYARYLAERWPLTVALSRETSPLQAGERAGHITAVLPTLACPPGTHYYLCGLDVMISEASDWLMAHGIDETLIHREVFFHAQPR
jgi:ferredoxin-NADP reductase